MLPSSPPVSQRLPEMPGAGTRVGMRTGDPFSDGFIGPLLMEPSLRRTVSEITVEGSQAIVNWQNSDYWVPDAPPPSPLRPRTPLRHVAVPDSSSPLSSPVQLAPLENHEIRLRLGLTNKIWVPSAPEREAAAVQAVQEKRMTVRQAEDAYEIPKSTISARMNGRSTKQASGVKQRLFSQEEDEILLQYIHQQIELGYAPNKQMVIEAANVIKRNREAARLGYSINHELVRNWTVGKNWFYKFMKRNPDLKYRLQQAVESKRAVQSCPSICYGFINKLEYLLKEYDIQDADISNMDEKGFAAGGSTGKHCYAVVPRGWHKAIIRISSDNRTWISAIEGITTAGEALPPYIIHAGKKASRDVEREFEEGLWQVGVSTTGWSDSDHALQWLTKIYQPFTQQRQQGQYRLLILDGHNSHTSLEFKIYCVEHDIILLLLPPHTSHILQPLDVGCFSSVQATYNFRLQKRCSTGLVKISIAEAVQNYYYSREIGLRT